jgi:hypothetical protein
MFRARLPGRITDTQAAPGVSVVLGSATRCRAQLRGDQQVSARGNEELNLPQMKSNSLSAEWPV